jgi:hypothetical protein
VETISGIRLNAASGADGKREYKSLSRVRVDWSGWSLSRRSSLLREFEATREEAAQQSKADRQIKGGVFFVGVQDQADAGLFEVVDYRLICCLSAKMLWPSKQ